MAYGWDKAFEFRVPSYPRAAEWMLRRYLPALAPADCHEPHLYVGSAGVAKAVPTVPAAQEPELWSVPYDVLQRHHLRIMAPGGVAYVQHLQRISIDIGELYVPAMMRAVVSGMGGLLSFANGDQLMVYALSYAWQARIGQTRNLLRLDRFGWQETYRWWVTASSSEGSLWLRRSAETDDPWGHYDVIERCYPEGSPTCQASTGADAVVSVAGTVIGEGP